MLELTRVFVAGDWSMCVSTPDHVQNDNSVSKWRKSLLINNLIRQRLIMFIKKITVNNFKGYQKQNNLIHCNVPNGELGSGLNILVGENNTGKSTIFEALSFIRDNTKKGINTLLNQESSDKELSVEVQFTGDLSEIIDIYIQDNKNKIFKNLVHTEDDNQILTVRRQMNVSDPSESKKIYFWNEANSNYESPTGIDAPFKRLYDNNFIWADTNPSDETKFGALTLCGSLLKEIALSHAETDEYALFSQQFHKIFNDPTSQLRQNIASVEEKIQNILSSQFGNANVRFQFNEMEIENFFKTANILIDDGISVPLSEKGHGMQRAVALSLLQVYADNLSESAKETIPKPFFLFIDEPEICMHPASQTKLLDALMKISQTQQVFITTHSPFMISSPYIKNVGLFIFTKNNNVNQIEMSQINPMFPWSPSWAEISYKAYNLPTIDLHNELYGYLQSHNNLHKINEFDAWLANTHKVPKMHKWTKELAGQPCPPIDVTLPTFIRHHIHHPENITMQQNLYTHNELKTSIDIMITLLPQTP